MEQFNCNFLQLSCSVHLGIPVNVAGIVQSIGTAYGLMQYEVQNISRQCTPTL